MDFMELVKTHLTQALMQKAAAWLGESESGISKALSAIFPTVIGAIASKGDNRGFADSLSEMLASPSLNAAELLKDVTGVFNVDNASSATGELGAKLLSSLFGDKQQALGQAISQHAGIGIGSVGKLLGASAPVTLALLNTQSKAAGSSNALMALLASQKSALIATIPGSIGAAAGLSGAGAATAASSFSANSRIEPKSAGFPLWLIPLLALMGFGIWWFFKAEPAPALNTTQPATQAQPTTNARSETPAEISVGIDTPAPLEATDLTQAPDSNGLISRTMPDNVTISMTSDGADAKLLGFIEDATQVVDKETWFELDRILFDSDTASMRAESSAQIGNIAAILKAFPNVQLKIGGYTDNSGEAAENLKLSADRADSVLNAIAAMGVNAARLKAEGYGPEHPVADNATEEGRQKNRRVSARVTAK